MTRAAPETAPPARLGAPERKFVAARWAQSLALSEPLQKSSAALLRATQAQCALTDPDAALKAQELTRAAWRQVMVDWVRWSTLETPLLREQLLLRILDARFIQANAMRRAMQAAAAAAAEAPYVASIHNTPPQALGLGAMEWLLWAPPAAFNGAPPCPYLVQVAQHWQQALATAHQALVPMVRQGTRKPPQQALHSPVPSSAPVLRPTPPGRPTTSPYEELVNQWLSGLRKAMDRHMLMKMPAPPEGSTAIALPRQLSQSLSADAAARWETLKHVAIGPQSLTTVLQAKGHSALAQRWQAQVQGCDTALQQWRATPKAQPGASAAPVADPAHPVCLLALFNTMHRDVMPALQVPIGFQDGDGG